MKAKTIANVRVGRPDVKPSMPAHTWGVREGNWPRTLLGEPGHHHTGEKGGRRPTGRASAQRSTGINAEKRLPIDSRMPRLTPP